MTTDSRHHYAPYLWHLEATRVIRRKSGNSGFDTKLWDGLLAGTPPRVALIDNGVSALHPNLRGAVCCSIDLATHPFGAIYVAPNHPGQEREAHHFTGLDIGALGLGGVSGLGEIADALVAGKGMVRRISAYADEFCMHGTACAGLIAGRPAPAGAAASGGASPAVHDLPYFGVDPAALLIAVNTPFSPEVRPIIAGILFALMKGANVICLPRSVHDARSRAPKDEKPGPFGHETRLDGDPRLINDQAVFEALLSRVAEQRPVVVASGNAGLDTLEYPASLVSAVKDLIVVGAVNAKRKRSSYTSGGPGQLTVLAPSDDAERWDEKLRRVDPDGRRNQDHELGLSSQSQGGGTQECHVDQSDGDFSEWRVLAVQVPRAWPWRMGKAARDARESLSDSARAALYMPFGGTSAACAIVAGIVSLMQRQVQQSEAGAQLSGARAKAALVANMPGPVDGVPVVDAEVALANLRPGPSDS